MTEGDMAVTGGKGLQALLMESDFTASGSATTHCNEDSSIESEGLDSDVEGAIYAQLYFQDGAPSDELKGCPDHPALSSSGGISVTVLPLSGVTEVETARSRAKKNRRRKKSSGHIVSKKLRLDPTEEVEGREDDTHRLPQREPLPSSLPSRGAEEEDSRTLAVLKKPSRGHTAKGMHEWVDARWSGNSSSEGECTISELHPEAQGSEGKDCIAIGPITEQQGSKRYTLIGQSTDSDDCVIIEPIGKQRVYEQGGTGGLLNLEDCVIVEVESPGRQQRKQKSSKEEPKLGEEEGEESDGSFSTSSDEGDHGKGSQTISSAEFDTSDDVSLDGGSPADGDSPIIEVRDPENESCPGNSTATKGMWYINEKDQMGRAAYDKRNGMGRYFCGGVACSNCKQKGHPTSECVQPKRYKACYLCSGLHHLSSRCPDDLCQYCLESRHRGKSCRAPWSSPATICNRCFMCGHIASVCSEIWRQCHNTTDHGKISIIKPKAQRQKRSFCYNCGASGHFGHECSQRRPQGYALPFTPIIASYDKNPPRGRIIAARGSPPPQGVVRDRFKPTKTRKEKKEAAKVRKIKKNEKKEKKKEKEEKEKSKRKEKDATSDSEISKRKVKFAKISPTSKLKSKHSTKLHSPPPRPRKVDDVEQISVSVNFSDHLRVPLMRRVSLPASTPESSRPQWNPYAVTPVGDRYPYAETRYSSPVESHLRGDRTVSSTPVPPAGGLWRRQSAVVENEDFPRAAFVPVAASRHESVSGESYCTDVPCTEWKSQPLLGSSVTKPSSHDTTPGGLPFLRRGSRDAGPSPSSSDQKSLAHHQGPSRPQRATSAPQGASDGSQTFTLVDGHYLSSRGFRGSERVVRKITMLKPDLKGRRASHQQ